MSWFSSMLPPGVSNLLQRQSGELSSILAVFTRAFAAVDIHWARRPGAHNSSGSLDAWRSWWSWSSAGPSSDSRSVLYGPLCSLLYWQPGHITHEWDILCLFQELRLVICLGHPEAPYKVSPQAAWKELNVLKTNSIMPETICFSPLK